MDELITEVKEIKSLLKELLSTRFIEAVAESSPVTTCDESVCVGTTGKGKPCTNKRLVGSEYCGMHGGNKKRKVIVAAETKAEKIIPVHTHHTEPEKTCQVCVQHGDAFDPRAADAPYTLTERLAGMLRNQENSPQ